MTADELLVALDSLRIAITIFDGAGKLVYANAHFQYIFRSFPEPSRLTGETYDALVRREIETGEIAPSNHPGGIDAYIAARLTQLEEGQFAPRDVTLADGRIVEIKARRNAQGQSVLLWSDVTQARHQFRRLEDAINLSADAFAFYDAQDRFLTGNSLYAALAGVSLAAVQGRKFEDIVTAVAGSGRIVMDVPAHEWVARRMKGHASSASAYTLQTQQGSAYLVRDRATADGGRAVVFTDITDKCRAEAALAATRTALEQTREAAQAQSGYLSDLTRRLDQASAEADSAKTTLLRTMSHELKTPLNAILGFSDLMQTMADTLTPMQVREYAGLVHLGGANLLRLVNQIMDLTKLSAGRYDLRKTVVDAGALAWLAREAVTAAAAAKDIALDSDDCPVGLMVQADETVLAAMLHHLLDNAVTFTHPGGAVHISAARVGATVTVTVADNGPGVDMADLARIQRPFEHAGRSQDHAKGAGLGLTLVKAFAELHGGSLALDSDRGQGFTAAISLPAAS